MKRTKLKDRQLPDYTRGEEIFNMVSHIVGGAFGIAALATCVVKAFLNDPLVKGKHCSEADVRKLVDDMIENTIKYLPDEWKKDRV